MSNLNDVYQEWISNPDFRDKFKTDPIQACLDAHLEVSPEDLDKMKFMLKLNENLDDDELDHRGR
jgi:hypothetical protein